MKFIFTKGSSFIVKLMLIVFFAISLIMLGKYYAPFNKTRSLLDSIVTPIYYIGNLPRLLWENATSREDDGSLLNENRVLKESLLIRNSDLLLLEQLRFENNRLRELLGSPSRTDEYKMVAQVLSTKSGKYSNQVVLDRGEQSGVYAGQPVINESGVVGQIYAVANQSSRAILVCDPQHALPVQVLRNDTRAIAIGTGCDEDLSIEFLPDDIDIMEGDQLVTSGLGGHFPEGYPVAIVSSVIRDAERGRIVVKASPVTNLKRLRYLLLLWNTGKNELIEQLDAIK